MFVTKFFETNTFLERVYVDTLIYTVRNCSFSSPVAVRYRTVTGMISNDVMKENLERILDSVREND